MENGLIRSGNKLKKYNGILELVKMANVLITVNSTILLENKIFYERLNQMY